MDLAEVDFRAFGLEADGAVEGGSAPPGVASVFVIELGFDALGHEGGGFTGDSEEYAAISGGGSGGPAPLEAELEVLVGCICEQLSEWGAFADDDAVFDGSDVFLFDVVADEDVGPAVEVAAAEEFCGSSGRLGCGLGKGGEGDDCEGGKGGGEDGIGSHGLIGGL